MVESGSAARFEPTFKDTQKSDANVALSLAGNPAPPEKAASPIATGQVLQKFGVQSRTNADGQQEIFYRAEARDNVVLVEPKNVQPAKLAADLEKVVAERITRDEKEFRVSFSKVGEDVEHQRVAGSGCSEKWGDMMHSIQPTLPVIHAIENSMRRSWPSQLTSNPAVGAKIYFLDRKPMPDIYGGKPVLGYYTFDKDGRAALFLTPAGLALPPTVKDAEPGKRNLQWVMSHEIGHNSQQNESDTIASQQRADKMGWQGNLLKGKNGEFFAHSPDGCTEKSFWYRTDKNGRPLDAGGKQVDSTNRAQQLSNEQVQDRALVRPISYYFGNPNEMMTEAITALRSGRDSRARLLTESPELYKIAKEYDQEELTRFYGKDEHNKPKFIRTPEGFTVQRERATINSVALFEREVTINSVVASTQPTTKPPVLVTLLPKP